jgi:hypothetical protein
VSGDIPCPKPSFVKSKTAGALPTNVSSNRPFRISSGVIAAILQQAVRVEWVVGLR